jgi:hypothetical protein
MGQAFAVSIQVIDIESERIQIMKNANHDGTVEGLSVVVAGLAKQISNELLRKSSSDQRSMSRSIFDKPDFSTVTLSLDVTYFGADYVENSYSRVSLSPFVFSISYSLAPQYFIAGSVCLLRGNYILKVPELPLRNLLKGRSALWGEGMGSYGIGIGGGYRTWRIRAGADVILFVKKETDLSPNAAVELHAEYYILRSAYIGLAAMMFNGAGLINPDRIGPQVPSEDVGISRREWASPTAIIFRVGVDL